MQTPPMEYFYVIWMIALALGIWLQVRPKAYNDTKEPSSMLYIGVFLLAGFISSTAGSAMGAALGFFNPQFYFYPTIGGLLSFYLVGHAATFSIFVWVYSRFPRLNYERVIPVMWVIGILGVLLGFGQTRLFWELLLKPDDLNTFSLISLLLGFIWLALINAQLKKMERGKISPTNSEFELIDATVGRVVPDTKTGSVAKKPVLEDDKIKAKETNSSGMNSEYNLRQRSVTPNTSNEGDQKVFNEASYPNAALILDYDQSAKDIWAAIQILPKKYQSIFLGKLDKNPHQAVEEIALDAYRLLKAQPSLLGTNDRDMAKLFARIISVEAEVEMQKVISFLGEKLTMTEIENKIAAKYQAKHDEIVNAIRLFEELETEVNRAMEVRAQLEQEENDRLIKEQLEQAQKEEQERRKKQIEHDSELRRAAQINRQRIAEQRLEAQRANQERMEKVRIEKEEQERRKKQQEELLIAEQKLEEQRANQECLEQKEIEQARAVIEETILKLEKFEGNVDVIFGWMKELGYIHEEIGLEQGAIDKKIKIIKPNGTKLVLEASDTLLRFIQAEINAGRQK